MAAAPSTPKSRPPPVFWDSRGGAAPTRRPAGVARIVREPSSPPCHQPLQLVGSPRALRGTRAAGQLVRADLNPSWYADPAMSSEPAGVPAPPSPEEPLAQRVLRQARTGQLDEDRLLPGQDKRERDLMKKLDKLAAQSGWHTFVSAQAHAIATGKAPARRNAEIMVVQEVTRWRREVERFALERLDEFDAGIQHALEHPAPLQRPEGQ